MPAIAVAVSDSPASNGGRGLKPDVLRGLPVAEEDSPASNGGRGLKQACQSAQRLAELIRPPAMAGVD